MQSIIAFLKSIVNRLIALFTRKNVTEEPTTDEPGFDEPIIGPGPGEVVCYYGCPNSKKAQKLQLGKTVYR
ncbi:MAG: hypothetical protein IJR51_03325 [Clostridia bacterium]|nr:hypothetical protein [Clostridia bacterium]